MGKAAKQKRDVQETCVQGQRVGLGTLVLLSVGGEREAGTTGEDILERVLELVDVVGAEGDGERRGEVDRERVDH